MATNKPSNYYDGVLKKDDGVYVYMVNVDGVSNVDASGIDVIAANDDAVIVDMPSGDMVIKIKSKDNDAATTLADLYNDNTLGKVIKRTIAKQLEDGTGCTLDITHSAGTIDTAVVNAAGTKYQVGDVLAVATGVGGQVTVATITPATGAVLTITITAVGTSGYTDTTEATSYVTSNQPVSVAANVTAEQAFVVPGVPAGAFVLAVPVGAPGAAGVGIAGARVSAVDEVTINYVNTTAGALTPTKQDYTFVVFG